MTNQPGELGAAIEQIDRDAAYRLTAIIEPSATDWRQEIILGRIDDHPIVQAFAGHRIAATPTRNDGAGDAERMRADRDEARAITKRVQSAAKTIMIGEADELLKLREEKRGEWLASKTLDSEREANAILTEENATLRAALSTAAAARNDGAGDVEAVAAALENDLFIDDLPLVGTTQQGMRCEHYARAALSALSQKGGWQTRNDGAGVVVCVGCEGKPSPENSPCAICGRSNGGWVTLPIDDLKHIRTSMAMLQRHSEGCAVNLVDDYFGIHGLPGWLVDTKRDVEALTRLISPVSAPHGGDVG